MSKVFSFVYCFGLVSYVSCFGFNMPVGILLQYLEQEHPWTGVVFLLLYLGLHVLCGCLEKEGREMFVISCYEFVHWELVEYSIAKLRLSFGICKKMRK